MRFVKMHGLGNDFIITEDFDGSREDYPSLARDLCRRRWSVGADGLVVLQGSSRADFRMRIFNPDGSEAEMCGNALRCITRYMGEREKRSSFTVETALSIQEAQLLEGGWVRVNMGPPVWESPDIPVQGEPRRVIREEVRLEEEGVSFKFTAVSMGNPHCVIFTDDLREIPLSRWGPALERHSLFPRGANVEFVQIKDKGRAEVLVWERGAGETLACGTGACAVAAAGIEQGLLSSPVEVRLPGGPLRIEWSPGESVYMEGPAREVFRGEAIQEDAD